ncbi:MAG: hypothetical protein ACIAQU_11090 [Phycisphaerales bacterium JB064]
MGRVPLKGWLLMLLGASQAPLSQEEDRAMRGRKGVDVEPPKAERIVVVPHPDQPQKQDAPDQQTPHQQ